MSKQIMDRRKFCQCIVGGAAAVSLTPIVLPGQEESFKLRYIIASSMYGKMKLSDILPEVQKCHAEHIDIWPEHHANQREQIETIGYEKFKLLLEKHQVKLGIITRYDLGPFGLQDEMHIVRNLGGKLLICGTPGPGDLKGEELKAAVKEFAEKMKPHLDVAEELGITIGIENHGHNLIKSPDSMRWLAEFAPSRFMGIALAPYHLPQDAELLSKLIEDLGERLVHFYAWQFGKGCVKKMPKEDELLQMPGRGKLDFTPIMTALKRITYKGWTEIFMHPVPRGIPILPTVEQIANEINRARNYLEKCLRKEAHA